MHRRGSGDIWQGLWEPYMIEGDTLPHFDGLLTRLVQNVKHVLTHQHIYADFYLLQTHSQPKLPADYIWLDQEQIEQLAVPRLVQKLMDMLPK